MTLYLFSFNSCTALIFHLFFPRVPYSNGILVVILFMESENFGTIEMKQKLLEQAIRKNCFVPIKNWNRIENETIK